MYIFIMWKAHTIYLYICIYMCHVHCVYVNARYQLQGAEEYYGLCFGALTQFANCSCTCRGTLSVLCKHIIACLGPACASTFTRLAGPGSCCAPTAAARLARRCRARPIQRASKNTETPESLYDFNAYMCIILSCGRHSQYIVSM